MRFSKTLALLGVFLSACVVPSFAQVFWSNQSPAGITDNIWCVIYANGTFAAVTNQGNLLTSTDGLHWSSQAISPGTWLTSIAFDGSTTWVAVGDKGTILTSPDLKTWTSVASGTTNKLNGVVYTRDQGLAGPKATYIAVGDNGTILTSSDAQSWAAQPSGVTGSLYGITYTNVVPNTGGQILVCGQGGTLLDGSNAPVPEFSAIGSGTSQDLEAVLYVGSAPAGLVAVGANGTIRYNPNSLPLYDIEVLGIFEEAWSSASIAGTTATFLGLTHGNGVWVAAGDLGTIFTSTDGMHWIQRFSGDSPSTLSTAMLLSAAYSSTLQRFVVTGTGGTILVSNPPPTVFGNVSTRGYVSSTQTFIGGFVIEGTAPRMVLLRGDGPVLSTFSVPSPLPDPVLTVYNGSGTVVATNTGWTTNANPASISTAALEVGAFALPNPSMDSALLLTLPPGAYTAQITSAKGNSGIALIEAYTD
jgi:hypothetical protein